MEMATKRVKLVIPTGQKAGIVPVREFDPRLSWARAPNVLHDVGRVPLKRLLARERKVSWDRVDQAEGRELVKELPGRWIEVMFVTSASF